MSWVTDILQYTPPSLLQLYRPLLCACVLGVYRWGLEDESYYCEVLQLACAMSNAGVGYSRPKDCGSVVCGWRDGAAPVISPLTLLLDLEQWRQGARRGSGGTPGNSGTSTRAPDPLVVVFTVLVHHIQHSLDLQEEGEGVEGKTGSGSGSGWVEGIERLTTALPYFGYNYMGYVMGVCSRLLSLGSCPGEAELECVVDLLQSVLLYVTVMLIRYPLYKTEHGYIYTPMDSLLLLAGFPNPSPERLETAVQGWWGECVRRLQAVSSHVKTHWRSGSAAAAAAGTGDSTVEQVQCVLDTLGELTECMCICEKTLI